MLVIIRFNNKCKEILLQDKDFLNEVKRVLLNDSKLIIKNDDQNIHNEIKSPNEVIGTSEEKPDNEDEKKKTFLNLKQMF